MNKYEGLAGVEVKMEQMDMAEQEAKHQESISPPKKTKSNQQVIVIDNKEMDKEDQGSNKVEGKNKDESRNTSGEFSGNEVTPTKEDRTSRKIDFLVDNEEDEEADNRLNKVLEKWDEEEQKREEYEREAVAFWNQTDPDFIGLETGKWYDLLNNDKTPLEQPNDAYIKTFNKSCKESEEEGWTKVKSKDRKDDAKKKEGQKDRDPRRRHIKKEKDARFNPL